MSKGLSAAHPVDADAATTSQVLASERWPAAVGAALGDDSRVESRTETPDGGVVLVHSRRLPDGVPGFLQKFLPKDGRVTQTDTWGPVQADGARTGTWTVAFAGAPGEVGGTTAVVPGGSTCTWTVDGTAKVKIPVIGGRTEGFIAELIEKLVRKQAEVLAELVRA